MFLQPQPYQGTNCSFVHCIRANCLAIFMFSLFVRLVLHSLMHHRVIQNLPRMLSLLPGLPQPPCSFFSNLRKLHLFFFWCNLVRHLSSLFVFYQSKWITTVTSNFTYSGSGSARTSTVSTSFQTGCAFPLFTSCFSFCPPLLSVAYKMHLKSFLKVSKVLGGRSNAFTVMPQKISRLNLRSIWNPASLEKMCIV